MIRRILHPWRTWAKKREEQETDARYEYLMRVLSGHHFKIRRVQFKPFKFTGPTYKNGVVLNWNWLNPNGTITTIGPKHEEDDE